MKPCASSRIKYQKLIQTIFLQWRHDSSVSNLFYLTDGEGRRAIITEKHKTWFIPELSLRRSPHCLDILECLLIIMNLLIQKMVNVSYQLFDQITSCMITESEELPISQPTKPKKSEGKLEGKLALPYFLPFLLILCDYTLLLKVDWGSERAKLSASQAKDRV